MSAKTENHAFGRSGIFQRIQITQPLPSPTMLSAHDIEDIIQKYTELAKNISTAVNNNNKTTKTTLSDQEKSSPKLNLAQLEPFSKPTRIPPIGNYLMTSSSSPSIKPIGSQIEKLKSFEPINEQFIDVEKISKIKDIPRMSDIDSMDDIFKEDEFKNEFKRYLILDKGFGRVEKYTRLKTTFKRHKRSKKTHHLRTLIAQRQGNKRGYFRGLFGVKKARKVPLIVPRDPPFSELKHEVKKLLLGRRKATKPRVKTASGPFSEVKRRFWEPNTVKGKKEFFIIAPCETRVNAAQLKNGVERLMLGGKKVFIPPPPPIQLKSLEPFEKAKDIEDISQHTIKIENPEAIEGIDKHLQTINNQPVIPPIAGHVIDHEVIKPVDDIEPIPQIPLES